MIILIVLASIRIMLGFATVAHTFVGAVLPQGPMIPSVGFGTTPSVAPSPVPTPPRVPDAPAKPAAPVSSLPTPAPPANVYINVQYPQNYGAPPVYYGYPYYYNYISGYYGNPRPNPFNYAPVTTTQVMPDSLLGGSIHFYPLPSRVFHAPGSSSPNSRP